MKRQIRWRSFISTGIILWPLCIALSAGAQEDPLLKKSREFLGHLEIGEYDGALKYVDPSVRATLNATNISAAWEGLCRQSGVFKDVAKIWIEERDTLRIVWTQCIFEKLQWRQKLVFNDRGRIVGWFFLPEPEEDRYKTPVYVKKALFTEKELDLQSDGLNMRARLSIPNEGYHLPAVIIVPGSGPTDMDGSIGPNKPYKDIAQGLASRGIAVLRFNKRAYDHPDKVLCMMDSITVWEEVMDDALAGISLLRATGNIDSTRIFILGHSWGAYLAPRMTENTTVAGLIMIAAPARPLEDVIFEQTEYLSGLDSSSTNKQNLDMLAMQVAMVKNSKLSLVTPRAMLPLGLPASYWLDIRTYQPFESLRKASVPAMLLFGDCDYQVTGEDAHIWEMEFEHDQNTEIIRYPDLNHLLMEQKPPCTPDGYQKADHVKYYVINDMALWITKR